ERVLVAGDEDRSTGQEHLRRLRAIHRTGDRLVESGHATRAFAQRTQDAVAPEAFQCLVWRGSAAQSMPGFAQRRARGCAVESPDLFAPVNVVAFRQACEHLSGIAETDRAHEARNARIT